MLHTGEPHPEEPGGRADSQPPARARFPWAGISEERSHAAPTTYPPNPELISHTGAAVFAGFPKRASPQKDNNRDF